MGPSRNSSRKMTLDGPWAYISGRIMAWRNAEVEQEAIDLLDPAPDATALVIGYGPGIGVARLARRLTSGVVMGVDPSETMLKMASRRNRKAIKLGRVRLVCAKACNIPATDRNFDGAIAVNALHYCDPIEATALELARVMKSGAKFVSLTNRRAAARRAGSAEAWKLVVSRGFADAGFIDSAFLPATAQNRRSIIFIARRG